MSVDKTQEKIANDVRSNLDINWQSLIIDSESEIAACKDRISRLRKSIVFFKRQEADGVPFPVNEKRHANKS